ncbi:YceI family protein [Denitromonas iodatirespirans]|uniref:YceI family protein n=1 Tax=Denitromonas iodatirespirans TaxID=2795389 RepID=A0A944DBM1_DENI1|nr:YceI family protein [Denitromonas iodatirespirans]MBT0962427.1 YceI family protein [Denitromonas iodatirespirans]
MRLLLIFLLPLWLAACTTPAPPLPADTRAPVAPLAVATPEAAHYRVAGERSAVRFVVYRAGRLATLGHNHVIVARQIEGEIALAPDLTRTQFSLRLPVAAFEVDPPEARRDEGEDFAVQPSAEAVAGTRRNMLGERVLDAEHHPEVRIDAVAVRGALPTPTVTVRLTLRGVARDVDMPVTVARDGDSFTATADFDIRQTDFGITPMSVLGGALQVADAVTVRMRIVATRQP